MNQTPQSAKVVRAGSQIPSGGSKGKGATRLQRFHRAWILELTVIAYETRLAFVDHFCVIEARIGPEGNSIRCSGKEFPDTDQVE
ncbi:hypothetical protein RvY_01199 [Ramazzottius varieornatus]|uniref:Uncharacterized protein n=1 Tax=Ramazzottius varieornatus TaxID=947166 RepID=A0A1D1ULJ4_RAMVA|nr:hypothetical protein RvY_01199 [Ramazzottius varieornatus]